VWIRALARRLVTDEHAAQDVAQDAWVMALEHPPIGPGPLRSWLRRVVRNLVRLRHRSEVHRARRERVAARSESLPSVSELWDREKTRHAVARTVFTLEGPYRTALLCRYYENLPPRDIAARLGVSVHAVESRLRRGIQKLRARLDREFGDREAWCTALVPFTVSAAAASTTTALSGALIMGTKVKIGMAAVVVAAAAVVFWPRGPEPAVEKSAGTQTTDRTSSKNQADRPTPVQARIPTPRPEESAVPAPAAKAIPRALAIQGTVRDGNGSPVAGGAVRAMIPEPDRIEYRADLRTRTDATGAYVLGPFPRHTYRQDILVEAAAKGFATERKKGTVGTTLDFVLVKGGRLSGHVRVLGTGKSCADAILILRRQSLFEYVWQRYTFAYATTRTDVTGAYAFPDLPPDTYSVQVHPRKHPRPRTDTVCVRVLAGKESTRDIHVGPGVRVTGIVRELESGKPVPGARVWHWRNQHQFALTDKNGHYELPGVDPEDITSSDFNVRARGYMRTQKRMTTFLSSASSTLSVDILMDRAPSIRGRVVGPDGKGVAGAHVNGGGKARTVTDEAGEFLLDPVTPFANMNTIRVEAVGYVKHTTKPFKIRPGEEKTGILIRLRKGAGAALHGRVRDEAGQSVPEARIMVSSSRPRRPGGSAWADGEGRFRIEGLEPGRYDVTACAKEVIRSSRSDYRTAHLPGIQVSASADMEINILLHRGTFLKGRVVDEMGTPIEGVRIEAGHRFLGAGLDRRSAITDGDGFFQLDGLPVIKKLDYLSATKHGYENLRLRKGLETGTRNLVITLKKPLTLEGRVILAGVNRPVPSFWVDAVPLTRIKKNYAMSVVPRRRFFNDPEGRFTTPIRAGTYQITAGTLSGLRSGTVELVVDPRNMPDCLELVLEPGATLSGTVRTHAGQPAGRGRVIVYSRAKAGRLVRETLEVDDKGGFRVRGLPPGPCLVRVYRPGEETLEAMDLVELARGTETRIRLTLLACGILHVRVLENDTPVSGARILVKRRFGSHRFRVPSLTDKIPLMKLRSVHGSVYRSDGAGKIHPRSLPPGEYQVEATKTGYAPRLQTVVIAPGQATRVELKLEKE